MFKDIVIDYEGKKLNGRMSSDRNVKAWIIFAHGSGSSHKSKRNNWVAEELTKHGFGTLLFDLLTPEEDEIYLNRFNISLLADRLIFATSWLLQSDVYNNQKIGYFGASTGAAAALMAASKADIRWPIYAIVSRGGRPDLAEKDNLENIFIPTLLIIGSHDYQVIQLNEEALRELPEAKMVLVPGATHLFEEQGALYEVVQLSLDWFNIYLDQSHMSAER